MIQRAAAVLISLIAAAPPIFACAPAPHAGEQVAIVEESAVIQWDPVTKTEHFIRRATFGGTAKDFGFLVPTPTTPALAEIDDGIFDALESMTARKTVHKLTKKLDWTPMVAMLLGSFGYKSETAATAGARAPVEVLATQKLAGYEAAVLDATDANALRDWLAAHDYATTPDLAEWLDAYVKQGWKITAFKIDKSQASLAAQTAAVKMSFNTERSFFPYREPASQRANVPYNSVRALRIFFLGPERVAGTIGEKGFWPGVVTWSDRVDAVPQLVIPPNTRLTTFVETSNVRPGTDDLFFNRSAVQSAYVPPPYVDEEIQRTHVPIDVIAAVLIAVAIILIRRNRR
jgi:hypothetical protein